MKILHIITTLDVGGAEMMLYKLLKSMDGREFYNKVICLVKSGVIAEKIRGIGIPVECLGLNHGTVTPRALIEMTKALRILRPDIVQTWLYHSDLLGLVIARAVGRAKIVWNIRCSNMEMERYPRSTAWTVKSCALLSRFPDSVITNSYEARKFHLKLGYRPKEFKVIPNGFDLKMFHPDPKSRRSVREGIGIQDDSACIGMIARFDPKKDHLTFLRAASRIIKKGVNASFVLCGEQVDKRNPMLSKWLADLDLEGHVHLLGRRNDIPQILTAMDLMVSSSAFGEGFPNAIGEAMACCVPCVVTDVGDSRKIVGAVGKVVPPRNPSALAAKVFELLALPRTQLRKLGLLARERIAEKYSIERITTEYESLYRQIA